VKILRSYRSKKRYNRAQVGSQSLHKAQKAKAPQDVK
jgi:hypothetical protein